MSKKLAVIVLGLLALVLGGVLQLRPIAVDDLEQDPAVKPLAQVDRVRETGVSQDGGSRPKVDLRSNGRLLGSTRAVDILSRNEVSFSGPGERAYIRMQIAMLCDDAAITRPPLGARQRHDSISSTDVRREFCRGSVAAMGQELARLAELPAHDPYVAAYGMASELFDIGQPAGLGAEAAETITAMLSSIMLSERAGFEAVVAAEALQQVGYVAPRVQEMAREAGWGLSQEQLAQAQVLATRVRTCGRYGGCGPGQLQTMQACAEVGKCGANDTAESVWRWTHSPAVYEAARAIAGSLS